MTAAAVVELRCETDFVAKAEDFVALTDELAILVADKGEDAVAELAPTRSTGCAPRLRRTSQSGGCADWRPEPGQVVDTYLHQQAGRGVNAVAVVLEGGSVELAHDIAVHIAFAKPAYLSRDEVPEAEVAAERRPSRPSRATRGSPSQRWRRSSRAA